MQAQTLEAALEREHRQIDASLEAFSEGLEQGEWRTESLATGARALRRHIYLEEEFLFPPLRAAGFMAPVFVMLREHGEIWTRLDDIEHAATRAADPATAQRSYRELAGLLEAHNVKEEQILYPQADSALEPTAHEQLSTFLERGQLPEGWVCEGAR
jgi:iron-sulfur cluster repair protein YtfE (RIC family)